MNKREAAKLIWSQICGFLKNLSLDNFTGGNREGDTPDPISNSAVKPLVADGTVHKSTEE